MEGKNLDRKLVKELTKKAANDFDSINTLKASSQGLHMVKSLSFLPGLCQLDLSKNELTDVGAIPSCTTLRSLNLSGNKISDISALCRLLNLQVLNVGSNLLSGKLALQGLPTLCALIANDNAFTAIKSVGDGQALNTIVLKNNRLSELGGALGKCPKLAKVSVAYNQISDLGDSLKACEHLAELRIGHNQLESLPGALSSNKRLRLVDLGNNLVEDWKQIKALQTLAKLQSLTLKGCPIASSASYRETVAKIWPRLHILDNQKFELTQGDQNLKGPNKVAPQTRPDAAKAAKNTTSQEEDQIVGDKPIAKAKLSKRERSTQAEEPPSQLKPPKKPRMDKPGIESSERLDQVLDSEAAESTATGVKETLTDKSGRKRQKKGKQLSASEAQPPKLAATDHLGSGKENTGGEEKYDQRPDIATIGHPPFGKPSSQAKLSKGPSKAKQKKESVENREGAGTRGLHAITSLASQSLFTGDAEGSGLAPGWD